MAAAFGLGVGLGDAVVSLGASGSVMAVHHEALADPTGHDHLATRTRPACICRSCAPSTPYARLRGTAELLGTDLEGLSELAMKSTPGAYGLVLLPYLEGERTPNLPHTAGTLHGLRRESMKPEHLARAAFEGMLCGLADALDVLRGRGVEVRRVFLLGAAAGAARRAGGGARAVRDAGRRAAARRLRGDRRGPAGGLGARQGALGAAAAVAAAAVPGVRARRGAGGGAGGAAAVRGRAGADASAGAFRV